MRAIWVLLLAMAFAPPAPAQGSDTDAFVAWASRHATPLPDCETQPDALNAFAPIIGTARLVALGEPAHGAHAPLALRNCLFRYLVEHHGFTAIAIETGLAESRRLQDYVAGGPGDARQLVRDSLSWGFWRFGENVALVEWMHRYNADPAHKRKIRFYGIDMSGGERSGEWRNARITLDAVLSWLERTSPRRSRRVRAAVAPFQDRFTLPAYTAMPAADRKRLWSAIASMIDYLDRERDALVAASTEGDFAWARQNAVLAHQLEAMFRVSRPGDASGDLSADDWPADAARDRAMAENARWVVDREGPAGRVLVFAHNGHVVNAPGRGGIWSVYRHAPKAMGQHLRAALGDRMRIIVTGAAAIDASRPAGPPGTIDRALAQAGVAPFLIDIRPAAAGAPGRWLARDQSIRANFTTEFILVPRTAFDAMVFLPVLSPALPAASQPAS